VFLDILIVYALIADVCMADSLLVYMADVVVLDDRFFDWTHTLILDVSMADSADSLLVYMADVVVLDDRLFDWKHTLMVDMAEAEVVVVGHVNVVD